MRRKLTRYMAIGLMFVFLFCLAINFYLKLSITHAQMSKDANVIFDQLSGVISNSNANYDSLKDAYALLAPSSVVVVDTTDNSVILSSNDTSLAAINELVTNGSDAYTRNGDIQHIKLNDTWYCSHYLMQDSYCYIYLYPTQIAMAGIMSDLSIYAMFNLMLIGVALVISHYFIDKNISQPLDQLHVQLSNYQHGYDFIPLTDTSSHEISLLSEHMDEVLQDKKDNYTKILSALESSQLRLAIVESSQDHHGVITSRIKDILHLTNEQCNSDYVIHLLDELMQHGPINNDHIYCYCVDLQCYYLKIDTYRYDTSVMYIIVDMTDTVLTQQRIEHERDIDVLTSLYNRRGFYDKLTELFAKPEVLKYSAMILMDMDRLKSINDTYGHTMGDNYIEALANIVTCLPYANYIPCRLGGDEFALFSYGYDTLDQLVESINLLRAKGSTQLANLPAGPVEFSIGFAIYPDDGNDFRVLMRVADERMYLNKQMKRSGMK